MLFKSALVTQVSGSIGGMTGSHNRGGLYFRARTIPVNPNTPFQVTVRAILADLAERWNTTLSSVQRFEWNAYASLVPLIGPLGDTIIISGQNHYIRSNTVRAQIGIGIVDNAPAQFDLGQLGAPTLDTVLGGLPSTLSIGFDNTLPWAQLAGSSLVVWGSRPQNPSISFFKGPFRFAGNLIGDPIAAPTSPFIVSSPFNASVGQRSWVRVRVTNADARLTMDQILGPTVVT